MQISEHLHQEDDAEHDSRRLSEYEDERRGTKQNLLFISEKMIDR